jgi:hypothetical protein
MDCMMRSPASVQAAIDAGARRDSECAASLLLIDQAMVVEARTNERHDALAIATVKSGYLDRLIVSPTWNMTDPGVELSARMPCWESDEELPMFAGTRTPWGDRRFPSRTSYSYRAFKWAREL